jgi:hypothetical protein
MAAGSVQTIVVCLPEVTNSYNYFYQQVCPSSSTGQSFAPSRLQAFVLDPGQQTQLDVALGEFDYGYAAGVWGLAFSTVVGLYFVSHGIGLVLGMVRRG